MIYRILDVNTDGETVARIESNNGKKRLEKIPAGTLHSSGIL